MTEDKRVSGSVLAVSAYLLWGLLPIYIKMLESVSPQEVLAHRIVWSAAVTLIFIALWQEWDALKSVFKSPKLLAMLALSSLFIAVNWLLFIWGVQVGKILELSLGYYINPLVNVVLALIFLDEKLSARRWFAVFLVVVGVVAQLLIYGRVPWLAIGVALAFGGYGLVRKKIGVDAKIGLFVETLMLSPFALMYFIFFAEDVVFSFDVADWHFSALLMFAGVMTSVPLILFAAAANRIPYSTLGFFQYITPTVALLQAIFLYSERVSGVEWLTFILIWSALIVFSSESIALRWCKPRPRKLSP